MSRVNIESLMNAKINSIGNTKKEKLVIKMKKVSKMAFTFLLALCLVVSTCACSTYNNTNEQRINYQYVDMYRTEQMTELKIVFEENGLATKTPYHTVSEYQDIVQYLNEDNMIIYYDKLGAAEADKICVALGYADLNNFLKTKGYVDENGEPSISALREASEVYMSQFIAERLEKSK